MKRNWMAELSAHYERTRNRYTEDKLLVLFDIDGTILDMRYMILYVLQSYDFHHGTDFFRSMKLSNITVHEDQIGTLLEGLGISDEKKQDIICWYNEHRWSSASVFQSHRPFPGVLEVIRWFQLQPNTFAGINTGRPESIRGDTLRSLNLLGKEYRVLFSNDLLSMNKNTWGQDVGWAKMNGIRHFQEAGFRIFAFIDNEPDNLKTICKIDPHKEILLLHANTIFESKRSHLPSNSVKGKEYDLTELIHEKNLPKHIQFVWHGINDESNLRQFLASDITWGEFDIRLDIYGNELICRHDSYKNNPYDMDEELYSFATMLKCLREKGKFLKIDLKAGGILIDKLLAFLNNLEYDDSRLWFNGNIERLQEKGFKKLANSYPEAILQCPIDFLSPLIASTPEKAKEILSMYTSWGINRFSLNWSMHDTRPIFEQMHLWGYEVNIYNVPNLESFLQAVLLIPSSITSDFNFPKWQYYGRGSGHGGMYYEYSLLKTTLTVGA